MSADAGLLMPELAFETAIEHASMRVPVASPGSRAGDVRGALLGQRFESAGSVAVCEDGRLVGLLSMGGLLAAPDGALAAGIMGGGRGRPARRGRGGRAGGPPEEGGAAASPRGCAGCRHRGGGPAGGGARRG